MNFKDFKKVDVTKTHTVFKHPNGHTIQISHDSLSPEQKKQMRDIPIQSAKEKLREQREAVKMAKGGITPYYSQEEKTSMAEDPEYAKFLTKVKTEHPEAYEKTDRLAQVKEGMARIGLGEPRPSEGPSLLEQKEKLEREQKQAAQGPSNIDINKYIAPSQPQAAVPAEMPKSAYEKEMQVTAETGQAVKDIQADEAKKEAAVYGETIKNLQDLGTRMSDEKLRLRKHIDDVNKAISDNQIDPSRYMSNMSTMGRISTAVGLILGGIGAGMTQGQNLAYKALESAIDRDVDAQKLELNKKNNLLTAYYKMYGDLEQAESATKAQLMSIAQLKANQYAAQSRSAQAVEQNKLFQAQVASKQEQLMNQQAQVAADKQLSEMTKVPTAPKPTAEQVFEYINRKNATEKQKNEGIEAYDEYAKANESIETLKALMNDQAKLSKLSAFKNPYDRAQLLSTYMVALAPIVKSVTGESRLSNEEFQLFVKPLLSTPFTDPQTLTKQINVLIQSKQPEIKGYTNKLKRFGLYYEMPVLEQPIPAARKQ